MNQKTTPHEKDKKSTGNHDKTSPPPSNMSFDGLAIPDMMPTIQTQATQLNQSGLSAGQREMMAQQLAHSQGNLHMNQVMCAVQSGPATPVIQTREGETAETEDTLPIEENGINLSAHGDLGLHDPGVTTPETEEMPESPIGHIHPLDLALEATLPYHTRQPGPRTVIPTPQPRPLDTVQENTIDLDETITNQPETSDIFDMTGQGDNLAGLSQEAPFGSSSRFDPLADLASTPLDSFSNAVTNLQTELPQMLETDQEMLETSLPQDLPLPIGIPTLPEVTASTGLNDPAATRQGAYEAFQNNQTEMPPLEAAEGDQLDYDPQTVANPLQEERQSLTKTTTQTQYQEQPEQARTTSGVSTDAGPRPQVPLVGESDPTRVEEHQHQTDAQVGHIFTQAEVASQADYGEALIFPPEVAETFNPETDLTKPSLPSPVEGPLTDLSEGAKSKIDVEAREATAEIAFQQTEYDDLWTDLADAETQANDQHTEILTTKADYQTQVSGDEMGILDQLTQLEGETEAQLDQIQMTEDHIIEGEMNLDDVASITDPGTLADNLSAGAAPALESGVGGLLNQHQETFATHQVETQERWLAGQEQLQGQVLEAQEHLQTRQTETQAEITSFKQDWQAENQVTLETYQQESTLSRANAEQQIEQLTLDGEQEADDVLTEAETQAQTIKGTAESNAASVIDSARQSAASELESVGLGMSGNYESQAVNTTIMRQEVEGDDDIAEAQQTARDRAQQELDDAVAEAERILAEMEQNIQAILADASLTAEQRVARIIEEIDQAVLGVNEEIDDLNRLAVGSFALTVEGYQDQIDVMLDEAIADALVDFTGTGWTDAQRETIREVAMDMANALAEGYNTYSEGLANDPEFQRMLRQYGEDPYTHEPISPYEAFLWVYGGPVNFNRVDQSCSDVHGNDLNGNPLTCWGYTRSSRSIDIYNNAGANSVANSPNFIRHEMGHAFESAMLGTLGSREPRAALADIRNPDSETYDANFPTRFEGFAGGFPGWQQSREGTPGEEFGDMYISWSAGNEMWDNDNGVLTEQGQARQDFMAENMPGWIYRAIAIRQGRASTDDFNDELAQDD